MCEKYRLCKISRIFLNIGLSVIFMIILYISALNYGITEYGLGQLYIIARCKIITEHLLLSLVILIGGTLLFDCVYKKKF